MCLSGAAAITAIRSNAPRVPRGTATPAPAPLPAPYPAAPACVLCPSDSRRDCRRCGSRLLFVVFRDENFTAFLSLMEAS
jgi:hypothetical protein